MRMLTKAIGQEENREEKQERGRRREKNEQMTPLRLGWVWAVG